MSPPINVAFWTTFYETAEDPDRTYHDALAETNDVVERASRLWDWKDLSRGVDFSGVRPVLESGVLEPLLDEEPADAVETLGRELVDAGTLSNATVVTPAFLLHLAASDPDAYSARFPLFDVRVWTAFVFLTGRRSGSAALPVGATTSATKYGEYVAFFERTLPEGMAGRRYERALFRFGSYISGLPEEQIGEIVEHLDELEGAIDGYARDADRYLTSQ